MSDFRPTTRRGGNPTFDSIFKPEARGEAYTMDQQREWRDSDLVPPPRSAKRVERGSGPSRLSAQQTRHLQDLQLDEVCRKEAREGKRSLENRRQAEKDGAVEKMGEDVEKQNQESVDMPESESNRYRPFSGSKTLNYVFDWVAMSPSFYIGVMILVVFLATTLFLVLKPPRTLEVMRVSLWRQTDLPSGC